MCCMRRVWMCVCVGGEWGVRGCPHEFLGTYRLEADMTWTGAEKVPTKVCVRVCACGWMGGCGFESCAGCMCMCVACAWCGCVWGVRGCPHEFLGTYRLEADMTWTRAEKVPTKVCLRACVCVGWWVCLGQ